MMRGRNTGRLLAAVLCLFSLLNAGAAVGVSSGISFKTAHDAYVSGVPGGYFEPARAVTRAEAVRMLWGLIDPATAPEAPGTAYYTDVRPGSWYYDSVQQVAASGGFRSTSGRWRPNEQMTRGEFADMIVRVLGLADGGSDGCPFADIKGHMYENSARIMYANGWAQGYPFGGQTLFGPDNTLTRAEAVTFLNRVQGRGPLNFETVTDDAVMFKDNMDISQWYYYDVLEAATSHEHIITESGFEYWTNVK